MAQRKSNIEVDLSMLVSDITEIKSLIQTMNKKISKLNYIEKEFKQIEHVADLISDQYEEIIEKINTQEEENGILKKQLESLEAENKKKDDELEYITNELARLEQYSRNKNIEIHNFPIKANENCVQIVLDVAREFGFNITDSDIDIAHRLPSNRENSYPPIIVSFVARKTRDAVLRRRRLLITNNNIPGVKMGNVIYVSENLTTEMKKMLWATKMCARANNVKYVWFRNSKIFARKTENSPRITIRTKEDFWKMEENVEIEHDEMDDVLAESDTIEAFFE